MVSRRDFMKRSAGLAALGMLGGTPLATLAGEGYYQIPVKGKLKVGFVYVGPIGDIGWTHQHDQGRKYLQAALGDKVVTSYVENVPEARAEPVIKRLARSGHQLIFTTSFGYMDPTLKVAKQFPHVAFEHATGFKLAKNMGNYNGRFYEPRYLSGLIAGAMTKTNTIGYILAFPIPEVYRGINAFTRGLRETNPKAVVKTVWVNTWYDPAKEREAALTLAAAGADVLATHTDSPAPMQVAEEKGIYAFCQDSNQLQYGPHAQLSGVINNWGPYYAETAKRVLEGKWKAESVWGGLKSGMVELGPISDKVPKDIVALVNKRKAQIESGEFNIFSGPIHDQAGKLMVPAGKSLSDGDLLGMKWFIEGVQS